MASGRSAVAFLAILLLLPEARRGWNARSVLVGSGYAATLILFSVANKLTTAANVIFLQATAPLYVLLLSPRLLGEPIRQRDLAPMALLVVGVVMFFLGREEPLATAPEPTAGNLLALASGVSWGLTLMGLRWISRGEGPEVGADSGPAAVAVGNLIACLAALPFALPLPEPTLEELLPLLYLGVFQVAIAYVFLTTAIRHVAALDASLLLILEPVLNPFWVWLLQGEVPGAWSLAGCGTILGATLLHSLRADAATHRREARGRPGFWARRAGGPKRQREAHEEPRSSKGG